MTKCCERDHNNDGNCDVHPPIPARLVITGGMIRWWEGYGNRPDLRLTLVGKFPTMDEFRFKRRGRLWYAERDGAAMYFAWSGPENERGYGGNSFDITMESGVVVTLLGPWSSGSYAVNAAGYGPVMEVMTDEVTNGNERRARCLTVELIRRHLDRIDPGIYEGKPFPEGSKVELVTRTLQEPDDMYEPAVRLPDGTLWQKPEP